TLLINPGTNADQVVRARPPVILFTSEPNPERAAIVADLTSAYNITKAWRGLQLCHNRRWVLVQDELQAAAPANVWWFMHLNAATSVAIETNGRSAMLAQGSDRLWVSLLAGGGSFALSNAVPLSTSPNPAGQNANSGYRKLALHLTSITSTTLAVVMVPLRPGEPVPTSLPALVPLSEWGAGTTNMVIVPTNTPPDAATATLTTPLGGLLDVDLRALAHDAETSTNALLFTVSNPVNGTVGLLADGHTARFVPATGFAGLAAFKFTATDTWPDPRLLAYYDFELSESVADGFITDQSGRGAYGQLTIVGTGAAYLDSDVPGALGALSRQSLLLRESGDFNGARLLAPVGQLDFDFHDWTLAGWFKRAATTNDDFLFYLGNSDGFGSPDEFQVYCPSGQTSLVARHYIGTSTTDLDLSAANIRSSEWHHAAVSFHSTNGNSGTVSFFLDGRQMGSDPIVTLNMPSSLSCLFGGHAATNFAITRWFNGRVDDLAVFDAALAPAEVAQVAARPVAWFGGSSATNTVWVYVGNANLPVLAVVGLSNGELQMQTTGDSGPDYTVQASTNLVDWATLQTLPGGGTRAFSIPVSPAAPQRFYRIRLQ
ncbi:MAG TPA: LamG-like jellyroll fold domain-containing protein, partial [Candidatus Sulfotelmatobacter sp.]|nr:LamG-like jellyroll fold domain-containing protein [Candidatus Sulfotelmatobacter sp.]